MERDTRIFDIIEREHQRQKHGIELIADTVITAVARL